MTREDAAPADALAGAVYAPAWRVVIAALRVWSRAGLLLVAALVVLGSDVDMTPLVLFRAVAAADPGALLARIGVDDDDPIILWASARSRTVPTRWYRPLVQFPLFGLVPGAILFRTHQWIAYGGTFGQYYLLGLRAYLVTFAVYWAVVTIYLVLWANLWRLVAEGATLVAARARPYRATAFRRAAERAYGLLYYGGALLVLLVRLLP